MMKDKSPGEQARTLSSLRIHLQGTKAGGASGSQRRALPFPLDVPKQRGDAAAQLPDDAFDLFPAVHAARPLSFLFL